jgi:hypothetical protein
MKKLFLFPVAVVFLLCCTNAKKEITGTTDNKLMLRTDTINVVRLSDTLVIYESTCRGCKFEQSTRFDISDSLGIIKLLNTVTTDNNPPDMDGGSVSKDLILAPQKTGSTSFRLYKFWGPETASKDSAMFTTYAVEVR